MRLQNYAKPFGCSQILPARIPRWLRFFVRWVILPGLQRRADWENKSARTKPIFKARHSTQIPENGYSRLAISREPFLSFAPQSSLLLIMLLPIFNWRRRYAAKVTGPKQRRNFKKRHSWILASRCPLRSTQSHYENPHCEEQSVMFPCPARSLQRSPLFFISTKSKSTLFHSIGC